MKKSLSVISALLAVLLLLSGCGIEKSNNASRFESETSQNVTTSQETTTKVTVPANDALIAGDPTFDTTAETKATVADGREFRGMWLAEYELAPGRKSMKESEYREKLDKIMQDLLTLGITDVFAQVRANGDSIYPSEYFKPAAAFEKDGKLIFDGLKILIESAHEHGLRLHAWINPYRISSDGDIGDDDPIFSSVEKDDVYTVAGKVYLKPSSDSTRRLILNGVREILNYNVDGIHIDDYFYPTSDEKIDKAEYDSYINAGGALSLGDWRRANVSVLVSSIYSSVKSQDGNKIFSISPSGDIEKNQNYLYADVKLWCSVPGYTDVIIPQIYYGFENQHQPFEKCLEKWKSTVTSESVTLVIGLAAYKSDSHDDYAGSGENEWLENSDIIKRQAECLRANNCKGFVLFSYHHIFVDNNLINTQVQNLKTVL